jgi:hypothetical protein
MKLSGEKLIYMGDSNISPEERAWLLEKPLHQVSVEELIELSQAARQTEADFYQRIKPRMTPDRAARIRAIRCLENRSYRSLAGELWLEWGRDADWHPMTNQLAGVALCRAAAESLGEDFRRYPWDYVQA